MILKNSNLFEIDQILRWVWLSSDQVHHRHIHKLEKNSFLSYTSFGFFPIERKINKENLSEKIEF